MSNEYANTNWLKNGENFRPLAANLAGFYECWEILQKDVRARLPHSTLLLIEHPRIFVTIFFAAELLDGSEGLTIV